MRRGELGCELHYTGTAGTETTGCNPTTSSARGRLGDGALWGPLYVVALLGLPAWLGLVLATLAPPPGRPPSALCPPRQSIT
jgi:hypothetical protein